MHKLHYAFFLILNLAILSCGGQEAPASNPDNAQVSASDNPVAAATQMAQQQMEQLQNLQANNDRPPLEKETVKAMLPETILGKNRHGLSSNAVEMGQFSMTTAEASYYQEDNRNQRINVTISDGMGTQSASMAMVNMVNFDREEEGKRSYTTTIDGQKAFVEHNTRDKHGSMTVIHGLTMINIEISQMENVEELEQAYNSLSLGSL